MDKLENKDATKVKEEAGEAPSPNTKRRLKLHMNMPKLHINIPFFKHGHPFHHELSPEDDDFPAVSQSLPKESHMPSNIRDPALYQVCGKYENEPDNSAGESSSSDDIVLRETVEEDEPESEKHQSDLEENEKDASGLSEPEKQVPCEEVDLEPTRSASSSDDDAPTRKDGAAKSAATTTNESRNCLRSCLKKSCYGRPRASTFPGLGSGDDLRASYERHVSFSPDTMEPRTRNCKYREWIEKKCPHSKCPPINVRHEKRKCQLQQMRKVNLSDYMSKSYGTTLMSPMSTFGGDLFM